jgi:hypothetical protein
MRVSLAVAFADLLVENILRTPTKLANMSPIVGVIAAGEGGLTRLAGAGWHRL